jgi:hypothetical protein
MKSHLELTVRFKDDDLRPDRVQWQWRGGFFKNGTSETVTQAYTDATDAYIQAHHS